MKSLFEYKPVELSERGKRRYDRHMPVTVPNRGVFRRQEIKGCSGGSNGKGRYLSDIELNRQLSEVIGVVDYYADNLWSTKDFINIHFPPCMLYNASKFIGGKDKQPIRLRETINESLRSTITDIIYRLKDISEEPLNELQQLNYEYLLFVCKALIEVIEPDTVF